MTQKIIFQDSFSISGIMCFTGCGATIERCFNECLDECKQKNLLPNTAQLTLDAEPQSLGVHHLIITITNQGERIDLNPEQHKLISTHFRGSIHFNIIENDPEENKNNTFHGNKQNIFINLLAIGALITFSLMFPPSLLLTLGLTTLSFLTTAFTAKNYLISLFKNLHSKNALTMSTTVTLGWFLSLIHTLYHVITMPIISGFSMTFMCFVMPIILITLINIMDEIKNKIAMDSKKMQLQGMAKLFPQMSQEYSCFQLSKEQQEQLDQFITNKPASQEQLNEFVQKLNESKIQEKWCMQQKNTLKVGTLLRVNHGECFPVDCILLQKYSLVDSSLLTGEPQQKKHNLDPIPAGAINLSEPVMVYATNHPYSSEVNRLLFRANRTNKPVAKSPDNRFTYFYTFVVILGLIAAIIIPFALGVSTFSLFLQNVTGILFAICPCTIVIAHQLPHILSRYQQGVNGIIVRDENLCDLTTESHTIVFDKTGTLTTGMSEIDSFSGISAPLWERIYQLEERGGAGHPIAKAIIRYYEIKRTSPIKINDVQQMVLDPDSRGLSAFVQQKQIHIGSANYLQQTGIPIGEIDANKISQGHTAVYVAEDKVYQGVIYVKHEIRKEIIDTLFHLKDKGKQLIMLTGDNSESAHAFNHLNEKIFAPEDIHAGQNPQDKEKFLATLMSTKNKNPQGFWFIGDGLNDAPCAKAVTEKGGVSCAITAEDKTSFFTDICLNGSLDYLFAHTEVNRSLKRNIFQNQGLLIYSALALIAFIVSFSVAGISVSPLIPLIIMVSTTLMILFNSYRVRLTVDSILNKNTSWIKRLLASDLSIALLAGASLQFMGALLISTSVAGKFALPSIVFTAGLATTISSLCMLTAVALTSFFVAALVIYCVQNLQQDSQNLNTHSSSTKIEPISIPKSFAEEPEVLPSPLKHIFDATKEGDYNDIEWSVPSP